MKELSLDDFKKLLAVHNPVKIKEEDIKKSEDLKMDNPVLIKIIEGYPDIKTKKTGGYIWPSKILPYNFRNRLVNKATDEKIYSDPLNMVDDMIMNAIERGNKYEKSKKVYVLWHQCAQGKEVYVVDEGEVKFDIDEKYKDRRDFADSFRKRDDYSGLDLLRWDSKGYEFYDIMDKDKKKGTFLKIILKKSEERETCDYIGHQLFTQTS